MHEPSSAIVVRIRVPAAIERLRRAHDWAARLGVPAHVTILYPFVAASRLGRAERANVASIAAEIRAFRVTFASAARWPGVVYLEPRPSAPFSGLIDRAAARFPDYPPYAGTIAEVIPHLTVAESATASLDEILAAAHAGLPFDADVDALEILVEGSDGRWRRRWRFPLRP